MIRTRLQQAWTCAGCQFSSRMQAKDGSFRFDFTGTYTSVIPDKRLGYSFGDHNATVKFDAAEDGVLVRVTFDAEKFGLSKAREHNFAANPSRRIEV